MQNLNISLSSTVCQIDDIVASDIDDEKVMMSIVKGEYYGLESVGSRVWDLLENPVKVSVIIDALMKEYDVEKENCGKDVIAFLEELHVAGIVQVEN